MAWEEFRHKTEDCKMEDGRWLVLYLVSFDLRSKKLLTDGHAAVVASPFLDSHGGNLDVAGEGGLLF